MLLFVLCWGLLAFPLLRLTGGPVASSELAAPDEDLAPGGTAAWIRVDCSHLPDTFVLSLPNGEVLFEREDATDPTLSWEFEAQLPGDAHSLELLLLASWPAESGQAAVRVTVEPDQQPAREAHVWVEGHVDTALGFMWPRGAE